MKAKSFMFAKFFDITQVFFDNKQYLFILCCEQIMIRGLVIISQLLISAQQFDSRKRLNMEPAQQAKSTQKNSSQGSQGHRKKRPSLFPIRNSARRKSSMSETKSIFDPHDTDCNSNRLKHNNAERDHFDNHQTKSETQFEYRTPSGISDYSSPRTSKSSPKDFVADTPFVPFVHQSITKTVWQSEQVIPEEKEDIDRKQSQTQMVKNNELDYPIKQQKQQKQGNILCHDQKDIELYPSLDLNQNNVQIKIEPQEEDSNFQTCIAVSIAIPPEQTYYTEQTSQSVNKEEELMRNLESNAKNNQNNQIDIDAANASQHISSSSLKNPEEGIKSENPPIKQETYVEDLSGQFQLFNQIQHHQYVSKASIYQRQFQEKNNCSSNQFQQFDCQQQQMPTQRRPKLSFSYIECISIRTVAKPISQQSQQTTPKLFNLTHIKPQKIPGPIKIDNETQIQVNKYKICNPLHQQIKSTKKQSSEMQTTYAQRLQAISKSYDEKIGIPKIYAISSQQTQNISKIHSAAQTDKIVRKHFGIKEELNLSICYNYGEHSDAKLNQLENFIKSIYDRQQSEIQQMKNRRSIDMSINTEDIQQNGTPHSQRRKSGKEMRKFVRDAFCQYDTKDLGANRPSLKRVSIAAAPIIHQITDDSNSTQTFEQMQAKKSGRARSKGNTHKETKGKQVIETKQKQIKEQKKVKLEEGDRSDEDEMYIPPTVSQPEQVKKSKSKRKASKTPKKKSKH